MWPGRGSSEAAAAAADECWQPDGDSDQHVCSAVTLRCKLTKFKARTGNRVTLLGSCHLACQHLKSESVASTLGVGISNLFISKSLHLHPQLTLCQKEKKLIRIIPWTLFN